MTKICKFTSSVQSAKQKNNFLKDIESTVRHQHCDMHIASTETFGMAKSGRVHIAVKNYFVHQMCLFWYRILLNANSVYLLVIVETGQLCLN